MSSKQIQKKTVQDLLRVLSKCVQGWDLISSSIMIRMHNGVLSMSRCTSGMCVRWRDSGFDPSQHFSLVVDIKQLINTVNMCEEVIVFKSIDNSALQIATGDVSVVLQQTMVPANYPLWREKDGNQVAVLGANGLTEALDYLMRVMSSNETEWRLNGVYFDDKEQGLVATDGYRLHQINDVGKVVDNVIICAKAIECMHAISKIENGTMLVEKFDDKHCITCGNWQVMAIGIEELYPDYRRLIPVDGCELAEVPKCWEKALLDGSASRLLGEWHD